MYPTCPNAERADTLTGIGGLRFTYATIATGAATSATGAAGGVPANAFANAAARRA